MSNCKKQNIESALYFHGCMGQEATLIAARIDEFASGLIAQSTHLPCS